MTKPSHSIMTSSGQLKLVTEALPDPSLIARISASDGSACARLSLKKLDSGKIFIWIEQKTIKLAHRLQKDNID